MTYLGVKTAQGLFSAAAGAGGVVGQWIGPVATFFAVGSYSPGTRDRGNPG